MVDQEVADILAEIREKVRANSNAASRTSNALTSPQSLTPLDIEPQLDTNGFAGLTVLSRAWDRLPPLVTNRTGTLARLDLWLKRKLKSALRWLTWEQVNFNAATHQTFIEVIDALQQQKVFLSKLQEQMIAEFQDTREKLESHQHKLETQRVDFLHEIRIRKDHVERQQNTFSSQLASFNALLSDLRVKIENSGKDLELLRNELNTEYGDRVRSIEERFVQLVGEFHELVDEFRGRDERLFDEQRVSFKQFSLELSESQVLQDRARRELENRLAKLEKSND